MGKSLKKKRNNEDKEEEHFFGMEESEGTRMLGCWLGTKEDGRNRIRKGRWAVA